MLRQRSMAGRTGLGVFWKPLAPPDMQPPSLWLPACLRVAPQNAPDGLATGGGMLLHLGETVSRELFVGDTPMPVYPKAP
jgi:hypothetical protein